LLKKILMLCGEYGEDYETMVPFQALRMLGHDVHAVCPDRKAGDKLRTSIRDYEGEHTYSDMRGHKFALNATFAEIDAESYDAILIVGRAPESIRLDRRVVEIVRHFAESSKPIAAVSHGTQILVAADVVRGRKLSAYPACAPDVRRAGGEYVDIPMDQGLVDGNLVTAPAWPAPPDWLAKFLTVLGTKLATCANIADGGESR
jgi:protease I